jgi:DNA polymerase
LEQRRDAGERELVLDQMSVEEVLRLVGAKQGATPGPARAVSAPPDVPPVADAAPGDWRAVLANAQHRAPAPPPRADAAPTAPKPKSADLGAPPPDPPRAPDAPANRSAGLWAPGLSVGSAHNDLFGGPLSALTTLEELAASVASCTRCPLYSTATKPVPGEGSPTAGLVCVGEAPGATEDATGRPFVGQAGKLLDKILGAIQLQREDVFICNVLKHRPPGNRNPMPDEVAACSPFLVRQLELIRPKVIVAFGTFAAQTLLQTKDSIGKLRGSVHRYYGVPLIVTYHPAALLRNPAWKRPTWEDVQYARRILDGNGV